MFEPQELTINGTQIQRARNALTRYYQSIRDFMRLGGSSVPCTIYELSTSASPYYTQQVLEDRTLESASARVTAARIAKFIARETLKHCVYWFAGLAWRLRHWSTSRSSLSKATAVQVGFVSLRDGRATAHDFRGFTETVLHDRRVVVLGRRLPQDSLCAYLHRCRPPVLPIEAHFAWSDLVTGLRAAVILLRRAARSATVRGTHAARHLAADVTGGHMISGWVVSRAITRTACRWVTPAAPICLPMERHDWELLTTQSLKSRGRTVWAIQSCTFSPLDLNMYAAIDGAPAYRNVLPDRVFVLSPPWRAVFCALGVTCPMTTLEQHRFSAQRFTLKLVPATRRVLYLGSINAEKVTLDLKALALLREVLDIEIRLHPSCPDLPVAAGFKHQMHLDQAYGACVYADTTLVFQLETDRSRLVFLDHPAFPNQNPAAFFAQWPGITLPCDDPNRFTAALMGLLE